MECGDTRRAASNNLNEWNYFIKLLFPEFGSVAMVFEWTFDQIVPQLYNHLDLTCPTYKIK